LIVSFHNYTHEEAARAQAANPGCAIVEVIARDGHQLLALPITNPNRDLELPGMPGMTLDLLAGATIYTQGAKR